VILPTGVLGDEFTVLEDSAEFFRDATTWTILFFDRIVQIFVLDTFIGPPLERRDDLESETVLPRRFFEP
jgi:hypothetical protein